jgi:methionine-rich copper-binding protein CopC
MKALTIPTAVMLVMAAAAVQAHAHLKQSTPAEGAVVTEMPAAIELTFSESARVTAVSLQKDQEPKQTLKAPAGAAAEHISVAVPKLVPGSYTLTWRVVSEDDGHIMSGELHFKVAAMTMRMDKPTKP